MPLPVSRKPKPNRQKQFNTSTLIEGVPTRSSIAVTSTTSSGAATDIGKMEDAVHASGDVGIMVLAVRKDTAASTAADGDYHPVEVDSSGRLWVNLGASTLIGEVQASPTANTVLDRLKTLAALTGVATLTDKSGTIATGAAAQQLAASNSSRKGFFIQNQSTEDMWFTTLTTAVASQPSIKIPSGASITVTSPDVPSGAISIISATTGSAYAAREW